MESSIMNFQSSVQITTEMANSILKITEVRNLKNLNINFSKDVIVLKGSVHTKLVSPPFEIVLKLLNYEGRKIRFDLLKMNPLNIPPVNDVLLNNPPVTNFKGKVLTINLDEIEAIKDVLFGNISGVIIENGFLHVTIDQ